MRFMLKVQVIDTIVIYVMSNCLPNYYFFIKIKIKIKIRNNISLKLYGDCENGGKY